MPKTIAVVDEQGSVYEPTYPKRARGLVKHGRARWLGEDRICLTCPPKDLEGNTMSEMIVRENSSGLQAETHEAREEMSVRELLEAIREVQRDNAVMMSAIQAISAMADGDSGDPGSPGNLLGQAKAKALGAAVESRERTNQQMLRLYEKMYDDLMARRGLRGSFTAEE